MPLGMFPEENAQAMDTLYRGSPMGPPQPHWYSGIGTGIASGLGEAGMKTLEPLAPTFAAASGNELLGALDPTGQYDEPPKPISPQFREDPRAAASKLTQQFAPDPATTGWLGQTLHQVTSVGGRFVAGTAVGGPLAGAALAGGTEAYSGYQKALGEGIDEATAKRLAAADFLMAGPAALIPFGIGGSTAAKLATGALTNIGVGAGSRALTHTILDDAGYHTQADQYRVLDGQSLASDTILGMAFGWLARNHNPVNIPQATVDAAHAMEDNAHLETGLFGDIPVNGQSRNDHIQNVIDATHAELNGEPVPAMRPVETIPNPAQEAVQEAGAKGLDSAAKEAESEVAGPRIEPEAVLETEAFHGTIHPFTDFETVSGLGPHFGSAEQANIYGSAVEGGNIHPVVLNLRNALRTDHLSWDFAVPLAAQLRDAGILPDIIDKLPNWNPEGMSKADEKAAFEVIRKELLAKGIDSIVYRDKLDKVGTDSYISLKPGEQIRSKFAEKSSALSRTARAEEAQKAETATAAEDPELADALAQVRDVIARNPDKVFPHPETGEAVEPQAAMTEALQGMKDAEGEGKLGEVAAACFGRG